MAYQIHVMQFDVNIVRLHPASYKSVSDTASLQARSR